MMFLLYHTSPEKAIPFQEYSAKVKELFPDKKIPTAQYLKERQTKNLST